MEVIPIKDRFTRGFLAGAISGVPTFILTVIAYQLKWTSIRWAHFASILIYGHKDRNLLEDIFATLITLFFTGLMGALFAYIIPQIKSSNYPFKGWVYGVTIWFVSYAVTLLFKVPEVATILLKSAFFNFLEASLWGLTLGYTLKWFDDRLKLER